MLGIPEAHRDAVAAHAAGKSKKRDGYGHTLKNRQHECLVAAARGIAGVEVFRPPGASFELLRVPAMKAVLFPWRYATDGSVPREKARMRISKFRRELLSGATSTPGQLTIEQATLEAEELEAQLAEEDALVEQLRSLARVVTIGYASTPNAVLDLGWGDADLVEGGDAVEWRHWEQLPILSSTGASAGLVDASAADTSRLRDVAREAIPLPRAPRFDDVPLEEDLGLRPRSPLAGEPQQEAGPPTRETGTEDEQE